MRIFIEIFIVVVVGVTLVLVYQNYGDDLRSILFSEKQKHVIYVGDVALSVTVADDDNERKRGLSGVVSLKDFEGKLFIFDWSAKHGIWMKDMLIPIDILWFDENLELISIKENITPDTYPEIFSPETPARFVLETNALFVDSLKIKMGDRLNLPSSILPADIKESLQN